MNTSDIKRQVLEKFAGNESVLSALEVVFANASRYEYLRRNDVLVYIARTANDGTSSLLAGGDLDAAVDSLINNGDPLDKVFPT